MKSAWTNGDDNNEKEEANDINQGPIHGTTGLKSKLQLPLLGSPLSSHVHYLNK